MDKTHRDSGDRFGFEWNKYKELLPIYEEQFQRWTPQIQTQDWKGMNFLDVGCGMGRNSYWPLKYGAESGVSIDIDDNSLESAKQTLSTFNNVEIQKISAYDIPFENRFDISFSIGVIHHLNHPEQALQNMVKATKPGGKVLIWVYGRENNRWLIYLLNPVRKLIFSKLPIRVTHALSIFPTAMLWALLRIGVAPNDYFKLIRQFSFAHLRSIVFDQMLPNIANYWSKEEVFRLMSETGLEDIDIQWVNQISWTALGTKPIDKP